MKYTACMIAWNDPDAINKTGAWASFAELIKDKPWPWHELIRVGPWPDKTGWSDEFINTTGACMLKIHKMTEWQRIALMLTDFQAIVVRSHLDPQLVHEAFLDIEEYRQVIAPDFKGATVVQDGVERLCSEVGWSP